MYATTLLFPSLLAAAPLAAPAPAGDTTPTLTRLLDSDDAVQPVGEEPGYHSGTMVFLGREGDFGPLGVYTLGVDGPGEPDLVTSGAPGHDVHDGVVVLADDSGIVLFEDGVETVLLDTSDGSGLDSIDPRGPALGDAGVAFYDLTQTSISPPAFNRNHAFVSDEGEFDLLHVLGTPAPGGGSFLQSSTLVDPALGGDAMVFSHYVFVEGFTGDAGVYVYDVPSEELRLVSDPATPMPGHDELFDFYFGVATDGELVAFSGKDDQFVHFGAHMGVYVAPVPDDADTPFTDGPFVEVARTGDPAPRGGTFEWFSEVAIDGDLLLFEGARFEDGFNGMGVYAARLDGPAGTPVLEAVVQPGDVLDGGVVLRAEANELGLHAGRAVVYVLFEDFDEAYYLVELGAVAVSGYGAGLAGSGGVEPALAYEGSTLAGGTGALVVSDGLGGADALLVVGLAQASRPFAGGTLLVDPAGAVVLPLTLDGPGGAAGEGDASVPVTIPDAPELAGLELHAQVGVLDPGAPEGLALSPGLTFAFL